MGTIETIKGKVTRVIFKNEETGYKVLKVTPVRGHAMVVTGEFGPEMIPGSVAEFHGDFKVTPKYGHQFKIKSYTVSFDAGEMNSIKLFIDTIAPNIGVERSSIIVDHFGKETIEILEKEPHRLTEVYGIGDWLAGVIAKAWVENRDKWKEERQQYSLRAFLNSLGIKERRVKKVLAYFGGGFSAEDKIKENPYVLCDIEGFGFTTADHIAKQAGFQEESELRFRAFIIYAVEVLCPSYGHLYLEKQSIISLTKKYCSDNATTFLGREVNSEDLENSLKNLSDEKRIVVDNNLVYSKICYDYEKKAANRLTSIMQKESDLIFLTKDDVEKHITVFEKENNITLSDKQKDALYDFAEKKVFIITGAPGTGKCLGKDTPVMLFDGTTKLVQDILVGDQLMGDDSKPRNVLSTCRGQEQMYEIKQDEADTYVVNESHILSLKIINSFKLLLKTVDISLLDYLKLDKFEKRFLMGYKIIGGEAKLTRIRVKKTYFGDYYGFQIDGNGRFLLGDFTVTHNTTLLRAVVSLIKKLKLNLTCMTPTGISAKKLATTVDFDAYTIHRRLGFRGKQWTHDESNPFEADVVVVDETSMVDQEVLYRLLCALRDRTHIIFVGDDNQLPSVGAGNVLREMINCGHLPVVRLDQIFRQSETSDIIKVAHQIKDGNTDLSLFKEDPKANVFFIREQNPTTIESTIVAIAQRFKRDKKMFQIITPRNEGPASVDTLNNLLQAVLNPPSFDLEEMACYKHLLRKGDRIIVRKNDYERGIYNGDIGKILSIGGGFITIEVDERAIQLTVDEVEEKIKLAYSITIHRSQGLEYPYIIIPFINQHGKNMLQRNLLYTAITRAKEKVIIIGHGSAIERAINNSSVTKRNTKLGERIGECLQLKQKSSLLILPEEQVSSLGVPKDTEQPSLAGLLSCLTDITEE